MLDNNEDLVIVRSTVDLAHNMGRRVVAEGVESQAVLNMLIELGCDMAQGYHISRPVTAPVLTRWLETQAGACSAIKTVSKPEVALMSWPAAPRVYSQHRRQLSCRVAQIARTTVGERRRRVNAFRSGVQFLLSSRRAVCRAASSRE